MFDTVVEDQVDYVRAYFGMRKISLGRVGGEKNLRPLLNDKFVFHMGMLDQVRLFTAKSMVSRLLLKMHRSPSAPMQCLWIARTPLMSVESACVIIIIVLLLVSSLLVILFVWIHL